MTQEGASESSVKAPRNFQRVVVTRSFYVERLGHDSGGLAKSRLRFVSTREVCTVSSSRVLEDIGFHRLKCLCYTRCS